MNTSTLSVSTILLSFLFLTACGGGGDVGDDVFKVDGGGNSLTDSLRLADLNCWDSTCPSNVGLIAMTDYGYGSAEGQCSGFLIADDIVATNSHCIPDDLKSSYSTSDCSGHLAIRFLPNDGKAEIFKCKELLNYSDYEKDSAGRDYAFFRISSTERTPFKIHKGGIKDNQALELRRVTPLSYTFGGDINTLKCRNVLNSFIKVEASSPWFSTGAAVDCQTVQGNSGSPMVDTVSGEVVGIAQAYWKDAYKNRIRRTLRKIDITMPRFPEHTLFTNLSCVKDPVTKTSNSAFCKKNLELDFLQCVRPADQVIFNLVDENFRRWEKRLNSKFLYKIKRSENKKDDDASEIILTAEPICSKHSTESTGFAGFNKAPQVSTKFYSSVKFDTKLDVDKDLRIKIDNLRFSMSEEKTTDVFITYWEDDKTWRGTKADSKKYSFLQEDVPFEIPSCTNEMIAQGNQLVVEKSDGEEVALENYKVEDTLEADELEELKTCKEIASMREEIKNN